jgi:hypothetical protein
MTLPLVRRAKLGIVLLLKPSASFFVSLVEKFLN